MPEATAHKKVPLAQQYAVVVSDSCWFTQALLWDPHRNGAPLSRSWLAWQSRAMARHREACVQKLVCASRWCVASFLVLLDSNQRSSPIIVLCATLGLSRPRRVALHIRRRTQCRVGRWRPRRTCLTEALAWGMCGAKHLLDACPRRRPLIVEAGLRGGSCCWRAPRQHIRDRSLVPLGAVLCD